MGQVEGGKICVADSKLHRSQPSEGFFAVSTSSSCKIYHDAFLPELSDLLANRTLRHLPPVGLRGGTVGAAEKWLSGGSHAERSSTATPSRFEQIRFSELEKRLRSCDHRSKYSTSLWTAASPFIPATPRAALRTKYCCGANRSYLASPTAVSPILRQAATYLAKLLIYHNKSRQSLFLLGRDPT
jgi:hypothetical protein